MNEQNDKFEYAYTAPTEEERREIRSIRKDYQPSKNESKFERLKKLDSRVKNSAVCVAWIFGIAGCLIFGLGMTMVLEWNLWVWGIIVAAIGAIPMGLSYFMYNLVLKKNKKKYGEEILKLSGELLNEQDRKS